MKLKKLQVLLFFVFCCVFGDTVCNEVYDLHCWDDSVDPRVDWYEVTSWTNLLVFSYPLESDEISVFGGPDELFDDDIFTAFEMGSDSSQSIEILFPERIYIGAMLVHTDETKTSSG